MKNMISKLFAIGLSIIMTISFAIFASAEATTRKKGFTFAVVNYYAGNTVTFTYYGKQPDFFGSTEPGRFQRVMVGKDFGVYNFNLKSANKSNTITFTAVSVAKGPLGTITIELEDPSEELSEEVKKQLTPAPSTKKLKGDIIIGDTYSKSSTCTFTVYGEKPESLSATAEGEFELVFEGKNFTTYNFGFEGYAKDCTITAVLPSGKTISGEVVVIE
ncbi:MAG: hypothetical protein IJ809_00610 [Clostridia bacterium]|nr:hypothetical protein [Clostridia bacterium]